MYRLNNQIPMNFHNELIVDNFAGGEAVLANDDRTFAKVSAPR